MTIHDASMSDVWRAQRRHQDKERREMCAALDFYHDDTLLAGVQARVRTVRRLGLWDTGETDHRVLCDQCADRLSRDGEMPAAELLERGGWLLDETCDRCHCSAAPEHEGES